jgi:hypothetical protein
MFLPPNEFCEIRSQRRQAVVGIHQNMNEAVQNPDEDEVVSRMEHQVQPSPGDHGGVVEQMQEGNLIFFLPQHEEDCI